MGLWSELSNDGRVLLLACGVRNLGYGYLSVILGLYLAALGLSIDLVGFIFTATLAGGAVMTLGLTAFADRVGRRRVLVAGAALMAFSGPIFAVTDQVAILTFAAIMGAMSPSGKDVGPFLSI